jgi:type IV pilus assembly protein PilM
MLEDGGFQGRDVVSVLPNDEVRTTSVRLSEAEMEDVEGSLKKEAQQRFGLDAERDAVHWLYAGNVRQGDETKNELILLAVSDDSVRGHIEMLEEAGLRPVGIDTVPCALFRSFERLLRRQEDREQTMVFVDIGSHYTTVVFGRDAEITFVKQIPIGGARFDKEIASRLGITPSEARRLRRILHMEKRGQASDKEGLDPATRQVTVDSVGGVAEDLAKELSLCFKYYTVTFRGKRVQRVMVTGGEAHEGIMMNVLNRQLTAEIEVAQPLRGFDMREANFESDRRGVLSEWAVAVGLGLKGWDGWK